MDEELGPASRARWDCASQGIMPDPFSSQGRSAPEPEQYKHKHKHKQKPKQGEEQGEQQDPEPGESAPPPRFSPDEEASLLAESHTLKADANKLFASADYPQAISRYDAALASCPNYLDYEIAVLKSNIAACHLKLEDWKSAVEAAGAALDCLERLAPQKKKPKKSKPKDKDDAGSKAAEGGTDKHNDTKPNDDQDDDDDDDADDANEPNPAVVELPPSTTTSPSQESAFLHQLQLNDARLSAISRLRSKSLMRRARGKSSLGGWANLQAAEDDYKVLASVADLPPQDRKIVQAALRELPGRVKEAREREMGEMMGKLKELGNGILKPFGLSTDMFKMTKDEKTGGYSMSMNQNG